MGHKFDNIFMLKGSLLNITMYEHFDYEKPRRRQENCYSLH